MKLGELKDKEILILGFGREGIDSFKFLRKLFPKKILGIGDKKELKELDKPLQILFRKTLADKKIRLHLGENYLKALKDYDIIIKSPGISPKVIAPFITKRQRITSQTEIFFENCPGKIIGITGTKGKGTTSSLIYRILKEGGFKVHLIGNIGKPVLSTLFKVKANDIFVYELSSHQLYNLKKSPQIAVFLNLFAAHLDYYKNFREYVNAKANITRYQTNRNYLIFNSQDKFVKKIAKSSRAKKIPIPTNLEFIKNIRIPLIGKFNLKNVMAAVVVGKLFNIPKKKIREAIKSFKPLPYRLEFVGKYKGIEFYNDSLATVPQAVEAALEALENNKVKTLILGGYDQGSIDFASLAKKILESKIRTLIFLSPGTAEIIWQKILSLKTKKRSSPEAFFVSSMKEAVKIAYQKTKRGETCLLSPASPSFNLFRDYKERGNLFKKYVKKYGKKSSSS